MDTKEAIETVKEIATDIFGKRGDIPAERVRQWARAYTHWQAAVAILTPEQLSDAIHNARMDWLEPLAAGREDTRYEEIGEAAYGRED